MPSFHQTPAQLPLRLQLLQGADELGLRPGLASAGPTPARDEPTSAGGNSRPSSGKAIRAEAAHNCPTGSDSHLARTARAKGRR